MVARRFYIQAVWLVFLLVSVFMLSSQTKDILIVTESLYCDNETLELHLPKGYLSKDTFQYMEGFIQTYVYADSSSVSILCGANASLNVRGSTKDGLHFRKIKYSGHDMTYDRVHPKMKQLFDEAFDIMERKK